MTRLLITLASVAALGLSATMFLSADEATARQSLRTAATAAQPAAPEDCPRDEPKWGHTEFDGFPSCGRCHNRAVDPKDPSTETVRGRPLRFPSEEWVFQGEVGIIKKSDAHLQAYAVLFTERSRNMGRILGVEEIHRDKRCLACHTGYPVDMLETDPEDEGLVVKGLAKENPDLEFGVTCEGCHGGADRWTKEHIAWREETPEHKLTFGFVDVRSPVARTRMCLSCHLGNGAMGRVVTHEMYAAGHPVLPNFEIEAFSRQMPEHWNEFADKPRSLQKDFITKTKDHRFKGDFAVENLNRTRSMLVASLVTVAESVRLNAELAGDHVKAPVETKQWPEMAQFDCFACHHDIEEDGWRFRKQFARRRAGARPGRPPLREWPWAMVEVATTVGAKHGLSQLDVQKFRVAVDGVSDLVGTHPYGGSDLVKFAGVSCDAAKAADKLAVDLETAAIPHANGADVLRTIAEIARRKDTLWDYDSARQLAWAFETVLVEMETQVERAKDQEWDAELKPLPKAGELREELAGLAFGDESSGLLTLDLRIALDRPDFEFEGAPFAIQEIKRKERLRPIQEYDPIAFRETFDEIARLLP